PEDRDVYDPEALRDRILFSQPEKQAMERIRSWGFSDCFRKHHDEAGHYSWWDYRMNQFRRGNGLRIDHIWASPAAAEACTACDILVEPLRPCPGDGEFRLAMRSAMTKHSGRSRVGKQA
ncbi:MAG: endonuclease/exonuclease/phosphatase family protein, partial [Thiohalorhabdaceae bacterium]